MKKLNEVRVLVVDDNRDTREMLEIFLASSGAVVQTARSANHALERLRDGLPDVIVCDIGLSDMNGHDLLRRIRALPATNGGRIPAIAISGFVREQDRRQSIEAGFQIHLNKPLDPDRLIEEISHLLFRKG